MKLGKSLLNQIQLKAILPFVVKWAKDHEKRILREGKPLREREREDALSVGVKEVDKVKILEVEEIPLPENPIVRMAMERTGFTGIDFVGISFNKGIYIKKGERYRRSLMVHELCHTAQAERLGGTEEFIKEYAKEVVETGYHNCSLEVEARDKAREIMANQNEKNGKENIETEKA